MRVPQVVCWQFQDFLTVLFPDFIRGHFRKEEMSKFISDNIQSFTVEGAQKPCAVELYSGSRFSTTLTVRAKFFTAKSPEVLQHWHTDVERNRVTLESRAATPIGLDLEGGPSQKDELRRKTKEYIHSIAQEPAYAEQVTEALRHTELPRKILQIAQTYCNRTDVSLLSSLPSESRLCTRADLYLLSPPS